MASRAEVLKTLGIAALMAALLGCSSESDDTDSTCNSLVDDGPPIAPMAVAESAPAPSGGTFADGTYELAAMTLYTGPGGSTDVPSGTFSAIFEITGNTMQQVGHVNGMELRYTSTFTISGTAISTMDTCPEASSSSHAFSASPTEFSISDSESVGTVEQTFQKR